MTITLLKQPTLIFLEFFIIKSKADILLDHNLTADDPLTC
jgi:hypothetical protein